MCTSCACDVHFVVFHVPASRKIPSTIFLCCRRRHWILLAPCTCETAVLPHVFETDSSFSTPKVLSAEFGGVKAWQQVCLCL